MSPKGRKQDYKESIMSEFIQDHEQLAEAMEGVVEPYIVDALLGMRTDISITTLSGSNTYNAYSHACTILREKPDRELSDEYIPQMDGLSTMGGYLLNIVNDSLFRDAEEKIELHHNGPKEEVGNCLSAEGNFKVAIERSDLADEEYDNQKNQVFVDDQGELVLFRKGYGEPSALSFVDLSLNGIAYPAGTLFNVGKSRYSYGQKIAPKTYLHSLEEVISIAPLRSALYALPTVEQLPSATRTGTYNVVGVEYTHNVSPTEPLEKLKENLPSQEVFAKLMAELPKPAEHTASVWVPKATSVI